MQKITYKIFFIIVLFPSVAMSEWWNPLKNTTNEISDIHLKLSLVEIKTLMDKLYKKNPKEEFKSGFNKQQVNDIIFNNLNNLNGHKILNNSSANESVYLAFNEKFSGDRVFALIYGITSMLMNTYNNKKEFYIFEQLDPQKFYIFAKNLEVIDWKLNNDRNSSGKLFLLSNYMDNKVQNLSFKRLIGKLISQQETMSKVLQNSLGRSIKSVVVNATAGVLIAL